MRGMSGPRRTAGRTGSRATRRPRATLLAPTLLTVLCLLGLGPGLASPAGASTASDLRAARDRLHQLERRIADEQKQVQAIHANLIDVAAQLVREQEAYGRLALELFRARDDLQATRAELSDVRDRLDTRARIAYIDGPGATLSALLGATTLSEVSDGLEFQDRLAREDGELAARLHRLLGQEKRKAATLETLVAEPRELVKTLADRGEALATAFAQQQQALEDMSASRAEIGQLVKKLQKRLTAEELATARTSGGGMTITFGRWAEYLLQRLQAPQCRSNLVLVVAWETAEFTAATWNPLATTYSIPGATLFNSAGVKNYASLDMGLDATEGTLRKPGLGYEAILSDLAACSDPMVTGWAVNASRWCRGCAGGRYVVAIVPAVEAYYDRYANR
jgi:peptidoglycan hydrolase CwlO-like protein